MAQQQLTVRIHLQRLEIFLSVSQCLITNFLSLNTFVYKELWGTACYFLNCLLKLKLH